MDQTLPSEKVTGPTITGRRERRRVAMVAAARSLFLDRGYVAVTLGEIVRKSGGSLSTLYELFENKPGLLGAIVAEERFAGLERLDVIVAQGQSPAQTLRAIAASIQHDLTQPSVIGMMRIVMAESLRDTAIAHLIYDNAHLPRVAWLASLFAGWASTGRARIADPDMAAQFFLGLVLYPAQTSALFCAPPTPAACTPEDLLAEAVRLFVAGYAVADEPATATA